MGHTCSQQDVGLSRDRFLALHKCVKFSDPAADAKNIRHQTGYDPILKIRLLVEHMKNRFRTLFQPSWCISALVWTNVCFASRDVII